MKKAELLACASVLSTMTQQPPIQTPAKLIHGNQYLLHGQLETWQGPSSEVRSPLLDAEGNRTLLGTVPDLLQPRFEQLLSAAPESPDPALAQFKTEVCDLLLAEVDIRLLPTVGLIEAIDDTLEHHE